MAAASGRRLLSTFPSLCGKLSGHQSIIVCYLKSVKNSLIRSYSNVGKSASFMMRSSRRAQQKRQDKQPKSKDIQHWMARTAGRGAKVATGVTDWPSVYSGAKSYHPSVVPVFFRMGRLKHNKPGFAFPMRALGNLQLMKIPNFFHLSPPAIEKHCEVLKPLCTEWPQAIDLSTVPLRITTRNYLFAGPSLYHPGSRKVKLQVYLKDLVLDDHARKKIISLVGPRYSAETDELTIVADRCPTRKQNKDYAMYLLTVLYHESWKTEPWETEASHEAEEEEDDEEGEKPKKKRKNPKRIRLINGKLYRMNQYGKYFKLKIKVKH